MADWADTVFDTRRAAFVLLSLLKLGFSILTSRFKRGRPGEGPVSLSAFLQKLGPTYVKFGQFLALRFDLLSEDVRRDLEELFENTQPVASEQVRKLIEEELRAPIGRLFGEFQSQPLASASIAQVHEARTLSGERVVVKVQRPGIERIFASDMRLMRRFAVLADASGLLGTISLREALDQFAQWTSREFDFVLEGSTADRLRAHALHHEIIPRIYWALTTRRVLTMQYIEGVSLQQISNLLERGNLEKLRALLPGVDLERAFRRLARASMQQIFNVGFFHGDPHPGNMLILPNECVAFVDFGVFGQLTDRQRQLLHSYLENVILGRVEEAFRSYSGVLSFTPDTNFHRFRMQAQDLMRQWYELAKNPATPPAEKLAGVFADRMSRLLRQNHVRMDMDLLLFWRVFIVLDAVALKVASKFDLLAELNSFFQSTRTQQQTRPDLSAAWLGKWHAAVAAQAATTTPKTFKLTLRTGLDDRQRQKENAESITIALILAAVSIVIAVRFQSSLATLVARIVVLGALTWNLRKHLSKWWDPRRVRR